MTTESGDEHKAGKPLSVRIVEWLGWTYVALGVWVLIFNVFWGLWGIVNPLQAGIWFLAIFVGVPLCLVWALRQGLRGWFLWPHTIFWALLSFGAAVDGSPWVIVAVVLLVAPLVILFRPEASRWFKELLARRKGSKWKVSARLPIVLLTCAFFLSAITPLPPTPVRRYQWAARGAKVLHKALVENERRRKAGQSWVDPSRYEDTESFWYDLRKVQDDKDMSSDMGLASVAVPWCVAIDPPDDERFPIVCTANLNPADLLRPEGDRRPAPLACPGGSYHLSTLHGSGSPRKVCDSFCDRAALAVAKSGEIVFVRSFLSAPSMFSPEKVPQTGTVRYLTPTGCIDVVIHK